LGKAVSDRREEEWENVLGAALGRSAVRVGRARLGHVIYNSFEIRICRNTAPNLEPTEIILRTTAARHAPIAVSIACKTQEMKRTRGQTEWSLR
jgi:hypothetical protein